MYVLKKTRQIYILVNSSVPQGSVLYSPHFLSYINDICNVVKYSKILMYVDD